MFTVERTSPTEALATQSGIIAACRSATGAGSCPSS